MKTGIIFGDRKVIEGNNKAVVVIQEAYIPVTEDIFGQLLQLDSVQEYLGNLTEVVEAKDKDGNVFSIPVIVLREKGVAKCSDNDAFDLKFGTDLADTRAQEKVFKAGSKIFNDVLDIIDRESALVSGCYIYCVDASFACRDHVLDFK